MTIQTWKDEFYPELSFVAVERMSELDSVNHSLTKWIGLRSENNTKHGVQWNKPAFKSVEIRDHHGDNLEIDYTSCALCMKYDECVGCPLYEFRKGVSCDGQTEIEEELDQTSPYNAYLEEQNPEPMIEQLQKTKEMLENGRTTE